MLRFDVRLVMTKEDIVDGLKRAEVRRAGKGRLIVQTVILALVGSFALAAFFIDGMQEMMSLLIGLAALVLIPVMWLVPLWQMQSIAQDAVESGHTPRLWVFDDGIDFGEEQPDYAYYPFHSFFCDRPKSDAARQTLVMRFPNDDVVVVPRELLTEEQWKFLYEKTADSQAAKTRHTKNKK